MALTLSGSGITSANIVDGTITNTDINASAAIAASKLSGTGKVLQVIVGEDTVQTDIATTTYTDVTGLSATITPTASDSTILVQWNMQGNTGGNNTGWGTRLIRSVGGLTTVYTSAGLADFYTTAQNSRIRTSYIHEDSPATTSAITYQVQAATFTGHLIEFSDSGNQAQILLMEIGA